MNRSYLSTITAYIDRPRIDALIENGLKYSLVLVIAGPGYGKTLSVASCMKTANVRLIWMRASGLRTRADEFWEDLVQSAARELPEYAEQLKELGFPDLSSGFEKFRKLTANTAAEGKRLVMVLDSYERIVDEEVIWLLNNLIESDIHNFTLFLLCRGRLPFADAFPETGLLRITDKDLAFDFTETKKIFEHYGYAAADSSIERALRITGGWPLGLRLLCETNVGQPEAFSSRTPLQLTADLHEQQYFKNYPKHIQTALILFSLLPRFSLELSLPGSEADRSELNELLMRHPFVSYDYSTGLYSFQQMYHEFLRHKQAFAGTADRTEMLNRAGAWFLERGMADEAMDCYWEAVNYDGFLDAVAGLPKIRHQISLTNRVLQRLEQIPKSYADSRPDVDFCIAFMYLNAAEVNKAKALLLDVARRVSDESESEHKRLLLGDIYATLADICTYQNNDSGLGWMKKAFALIPNGSRTHSPELYALGNNSAFFLPSNSPGELERMVAYFNEYAGYAYRVKNGCGCGYEHLFAGEAAYYREDMDKAAVLFNRAILNALQTAQHDIVCNALLNLARIELYYGNHKNAIARLGEIGTYIDSASAPELHELRDCATAFVYMRLGDLKKVPSQFGNMMSGPEKTPVSLGRKQLTSAYYLFLTGESSMAYALMLQLEALLEHKGRWCERLELYILKAQHLMSTDDTPGFCEVFKKAYDMLRSNDLKLALSGYGKVMMSMIERLRKTDTSGYDMPWLENVYLDSLSFAKRMQMMRRSYNSEVSGHSGTSLALTKRENETLRYLAQGLTQPEIAKLMGISVNAVKKHVAKIYYKLGAINRADAIHIASIGGLVDVINN